MSAAVSLCSSGVVRIGPRSCCGAGGGLDRLALAASGGLVGAHHRVGLGADGVDAVTEVEPVDGQTVGAFGVGEQLQGEGSDEVGPGEQVGDGVEGGVGLGDEVRDMVLERFGDGVEVRGAHHGVGVVLEGGHGEGVTIGEALGVGEAAVGLVHVDRPGVGLARVDRVGEGFGVTAGSGAEVGVGVVGFGEGFVVGVAGLGEPVELVADLGGDEGGDLGGNRHDAERGRRALGAVADPLAHLTPDATKPPQPA